MKDEETEDGGRRTEVGGRIKKCVSSFVHSCISWEMEKAEG